MCGTSKDYSPLECVKSRPLVVTLASVKRRRRGSSDGVWRNVEISAQTFGKTVAQIAFGSLFLSLKAGDAHKWLRGLTKTLYDAVH